MAPILLLSLLFQASALAPAAPARPAVRIGDVADVKGMRTNALLGTGLVVGLNGTGDSARATRQALQNLLQKQSLNIAAGDLKDGSAALVIVTAVLPPFAREGDRIDVSIAVTGGAKSLFGGTLLFTPLAGADGNVYAVAQGPVAIGGFQAAGAASSVTQNHPTVGTIVGGATIEADLDSRFVSDDRTFDFRLRRPEFETARRITDALNESRPGIAKTLDPSMVRVTIPPDVERSQFVALVAELSSIPVEPFVRAVIIINEKTGTIIAGDGVRISMVAIAHGNLTVTVAESPVVSQPAPFSSGTTTTVPRTELDATVDAGNGVSIVSDTTTLQDLAAALNALGTTPRDLITILQMMKQVGALHADLEVR